MEKTRILGIDFGERRIGLAISDPQRSTAQPLKTLTHPSPEVAWKEIEKILQEYDIDQIVVGIPYNMDGTSGAAAQKVLKWIETIQKKTAIPIVTWDERLTTEEAQAILIQTGLPRKRRKEKLDPMAAAVILQDYLHSQKVT
jgi:putative Holliday junction resolvase